MSRYLRSESGFLISPTRYMEIWQPVSKSTMSFDSTASASATNALIFVRISYVAVEVPPFATCAEKTCDRALPDIGVAIDRAASPEFQF